MQYSKVPREKVYIGGVDKKLLLRTLFDEVGIYIPGINEETQNTFLTGIICRMKKATHWYDYYYKTYFPIHLRGTMLEVSDFNNCYGRDKAQQCIELAKQLHADRQRNQTPS